MRNHSARAKWETHACSLALHGFHCELERGEAHLFLFHAAHVLLGLLHGRLHFLHAWVRDFLLASLIGGGKLVEVRCIVLVYQLVVLLRKVKHGEVMTKRAETIERPCVSTEPTERLLTHLCVNTFQSALQTKDGQRTVGARCNVGLRMHFVNRVVLELRQGVDLPVITNFALWGYSKIKHVLNRKYK